MLMFFTKEEQRQQLRLLVNVLLEPFNGGITRRLREDALPLEPSSEKSATDSEQLSKPSEPGS
jgi:hypothetical protein